MSKLTSSAVRTRLLEFLKLYSRFERHPGFSYATGLDYYTLHERLQQNADTIAWVPPDTLRVQVPITSQLVLPQHSSSTVVALSTWMSMLDDITTWNLFLTHPQARYGVSVVLSSRWGPAGPQLQADDANNHEVTITSRVRKAGGNLGFVDATVTTAQGHVVCQASHVKYLNLGRANDFALSYYGWPLTRLYSQYWLQDPNHDNAPLSVADAFADFAPDDTGQVPFTATGAHASGGGAIHGGAQAILMELAAEPVAKKLLSESVVQLVSMSVDYASSASRNAELVVKALPRLYPDRITLSVQLLGKGKLKSVGTLEYAAASANAVSKI